MKTYDEKSCAAQAVPTENQAIFMMLLRDSLRGAAEQMLREEVEELCGRSHRPEAGAQYRRAGSESGACHSEGRREAILRPRVRKQVGNGTEREHVLVSYSMMRRPSNNAASVVTALGAGMSTRSQAWASEGVMSKTAASRHWIEATAARIGELRERDLTRTAFFGLMLDGVVIGNGAVVVIALGLTCTGEKVVLDFEVGSSENAVVCTALVARLQRRGFGPVTGCRLFAVLDGSAALQGAVLGVWPDALIQRCLVHKERNLYGYLRKGDHGEAARLWHRLRLAQGEEAGREALAQLRAFLLPLNAAALVSLEEAGEDLITLHKLNVPATLNLSLLSTNAIENVTPSSGLRSLLRHGDNSEFPWRLKKPIERGREDRRGGNSGLFWSRLFGLDPCIISGTSAFRKYVDSHSGGLPGGDRCKIQNPLSSRRSIFEQTSRSLKDRLLDICAAGIARTGRSGFIAAF